METISINLWMMDNVDIRFSATAWFSNVLHHLLLFLETGTKFILPAVKDLL